MGNEKQTIAEDMRSIMDIFFQQHLGATVESLQINEDDLPDKFTDSVLLAATMKQNITQMEQTRKAKVVEFETNVIVAENQANVTIQKARGESYRIQQNARADAAIVQLQTQAEIESYKEVSDDLDLHGDDLIKYIWYDALSGGSVSSNGRDHETCRCW